MSVLSFATSSKGLKASKFKLQGLKLLILNFWESLRSDDVLVLSFSMSYKGLKASKFKLLGLKTFMS